MVKRKFDKQASLEQGEVVMEPIEEAEVLAWVDDVSTFVEMVDSSEGVQESDTFTLREQEAKDEQVETAVPAELTQADIKWAKANLKGHPSPFDSESAELLERLRSKGIAAGFGSDGFARGHKFFTV